MNLRIRHVLVLSMLVALMALPAARTLAATDAETIKVFRDAEDRRAFDEFTSGSFEFGAEVGAK